MSERNHTATRILDTAQQLAQTRGFNAFSYADIAERVGVRTATLHYYFPSKRDLGRELLARYHDSFRQLFARLDREGTTPCEQLGRYVEAIRQMLLDGGRMCLGGMLAADIATLSPDLQSEVRAFCTTNEAWLARVLAAGRATGTLRFAGTPEEEALVLFAGLEGAMLIARPYDDPARFATVARLLLAALGAGP